MPAVEVAITIRRPRRDVGRVMFNPQYDPEWIGGILEVRRAEAGPLRRGSTLERVSRSRWRDCVSVFHVVDHEPDRTLELHADPPVAQRIRYTLEGIPEGTIARIKAHRAAAGMLRLPISIDAMLLRRAIMQDLDRLKWLVEAGGIR
ncbi:MAG TPA: hypothetical protein VGG99_29640 [Acetobacteraceae bacterium]